MNINIDLNFIKNKFEEIYHKDRSKLKITPYRDWLFVFISMFILFLGVFLFSGYEYVNLYNESMSQIITNKQVNSGEDDLKNEFGETLSIFDDKKKKHDEFVNKGVVFFLDQMNSGTKAPIDNATINSLNTSTNTATSTETR